MALKVTTNVPDDNGIPLSTGFNLHSQEPLDHRQIKRTYADMEAIPDIERYVGMCVFVIDDWVQYRLDETSKWQIDSFEFLSGDGAPDPSIGYINWLYLNTNSGEVSKKLMNDDGTVEWVIQFSMITNGVKGDKGDKGDRGSLWWYGTAITGGALVIDSIIPSSGITAAMSGDIYYNTDSCDIYQCTTSGGTTQAKWTYIGNIRGAKGDKGDSFKIYHGTAITGTSVEPTSYQTGIIHAKVDELYINPYLGTIYECVLQGDQNTAKWIYTYSLKFNEVAVQDTEPSEDDVKLWIKPNPSQEDAIIPYVNDDNVSEEDTYSSKHIEDIIGGKWYFGTTNGTIIEQVTVDYTTYHIADNQLENARVGDIYFHRNNYTVYQCISAGNKDVAVWIIKTNLMNPILTVIREQGYMKAISVTTLPTEPDPDTIYFIQGDVIIVQ